MGTCFCRIEGRCLNKREFVFHTLNNNYQQWKEDNIPQSSKSPLEWRFSDLSGWRRTNGFASARLKGWKDTIADIKGVSDIWVLILCPNTDTLLYPLFWYCIFNDKGYWKSSVTSRHASSAYTIKKRGKRKNPVFRDSVLLLSGRCHINSCNSLIRKELQNRVWISGKKINGNPRLK